MATHMLLSFRTAAIRAPATSDRRKDEIYRRHKAHWAGWWAPLFRWTSESGLSGGDGVDECATSPLFAPGCFTEEKAKQLRAKMMETATFHDVMYHSAIASRLVSLHPDCRSPPS